VIICRSAGLGKDFARERAPSFPSAFASKREPSPDGRANVRRQPPEVFDGKWRATADEGGHYSLAVAL